MKNLISILILILILGCDNLSKQQQETLEIQITQLTGQYIKGVEAYMNTEEDVQKWKNRIRILQKMPEYQDKTSFAFKYDKDFEGCINEIENIYAKMKQIMEKDYEGVEYHTCIKSLKGDVFLLKELAKAMELQQLRCIAGYNGSYRRIGDQPPNY